MVKKTIGNTSGNSSGRRVSAIQKKGPKRRGDSSIENKKAAKGSNVNKKGPKANGGSNEKRKGSKAIGASNVDEKDARKRNRSDSLDGLPGNSRDNPINVDDFLSLFEPAIVNDYVRFISFLSCLI